jgi:hypothetical protein
MKFKVTLTFENVRSYDPLVVDDWIKEVTVDASSSKKAEESAMADHGGYALDYLTEDVTLKKDVAK